MRDRAALFGLLVLTVVIAGGYFYHTASAVCNVPIAYRIGALDPDFGLTQDEARTAITDAESLWEDKSGRNLFTYDEHADFTVNFIYDDRQARTDTEHELSTELEEKRDLSEEVRAQYEDLLGQYQTLTEQYEEQANAYNERLRAHNDDVERWNKQGGAPEDVYRSLAKEQSALEQEQNALDKLAHQLNDIAKQINSLGEQGNTLVRAYNSVVGAYNKTFGTEREFTQGDYQNNAIHIYQYDGRDELRLVLAHELGHSLGLEHVENSHSIMYYLMDDKADGQSLREGLTDEDMQELQRVCGTERATLWSIF